MKTFLRTHAYEYYALSHTESIQNTSCIKLHDDASTFF